MKLFKQLLNRKPVEVAVMDAPKGKYPKEVEAIHREFLTAGDMLLESAQVTLQEAAKVDTTKADRLLSVGFKQAGQVQEALKVKKSIEVSKETATLINEYRVKYPNNKFITQDQVKAICYKYNLVCGDSDRFKGFVPEKNLREIEAFKKKHKFKGLVTNTGHYLEDAVIKFDGRAYFHVYKNGKNDILSYSFQSNDGVSFYASDSKNLFGLSHLGFVTYMEVKPCTTLQICAPVKDMDLTGLEIKDGYLLKKHIPDPVVLQPVKGGYLVVTAWGDEASDELVINQHNN